MAQPWDNAGKRLIKESIQDFLDWLLPGAQVTGRRSHEFESRKLEADSFHEAILDDELILVNIELQSSADSQMEIRLLEYNLLAVREYQCPVYSIVLYLKDARKRPTPPFITKLAKRGEII